MIAVLYEHQIEAKNVKLIYSISISYTVSGDLNSKIQKGH
jgi:hypothetical protein